jgi:PAS domain S-box-containing protein
MVSIAVAFQCAFLAYAIKKYDLFTMENALEESERRFKDIAVTMSEWIWETDFNAVITYCSENAKDIIGYASHEIIGKTPYDFMSPDERQRVKNALAKHRAAKMNIRDIENWYTAKDGRKVCFLTNGVPLLDKNGSLAGYRGVNRDITEMVKAEQEKNRLQALLIQSEKMSALGLLASGVANEINNPMETILGLAKTLAKDIKEYDLLYLPIKSIEREALRCKELVMELLTFSRAHKPVFAAANINDLIKATVALVGGRAKTRHIGITANYAPDIAYISANANQIQQVLVSLCNYALDVTPEEGQLTISSRGEPAYVTITIHSSGPKLPEETLKHIFEPFFASKESGKGLGLCLCYEIMQKHSGHIWVQSEESKGTAFILKLPANFYPPSC